MFENGLLCSAANLMRNGPKANSKSCVALQSSNRLQDQPESIGDYKTSYANLGNASDAQQVGCMVMQVGYLIMWLCGLVSGS